ncbi:MAG: hypothetical protein KIT31_41230, partial [Deltaproteobacteria bacterium]|nr:hypothetical protein [Deltaproteobacteria bacterium]
RAAASTATAKLRAVVQKTGERRGEAFVATMDEQLGELQRYLELAPSTALEDRLARVDLLRELGRAAEARAAIDKLAAERPNDARVRARFAALKFETIVQTGGTVEGAAFVHDQLDDAALTDKDGYYWSLLIGAQGLRMMSDALPELAQNPDAGAVKMVDIMKKIRRLADELARSRPGRAAVLAFVLDRTAPLVDKMRKKDVVGIIAALRAALPDALALRAKHPETGEADRLVYTLTLFAQDRAAALAAIAQRPGTPGRDDADLYVQRAHTAISLAMGIGTTTAVATARKVVEDIPPTWDVKIEAEREAMLGDCEAMHATLAKDLEAWSRAAQHYAEARTMHREVRARTTSNLGFILQQHGGDIARAELLFREAADLESSRRWLPLLDAATSPARAAERLDIVRGLVQATKGDGRAPVILNVWLASLSPDAAEAGAAAKDALVDMADPLYVAKPSANGVGFESEGTFQVGLGIASMRLYDLNTQAYGSLWLMPPLPMDRAALEAKVRAMPKPRPSPKR